MKSLTQQIVQFFKKIEKTLDEAYKEPKGWTEEEWRKYLIEQEYFNNRQFQNFF